MYLGEGAYGVEAASRTYFGKSAKDLNLDEAATIAGLFQAWRNAPTVNMERAKRRQTYVLQQMADKGFITQKEADEAKARPIVLAPAGDAGQLDRAPTSSKRSARSWKRATARRRCTRTA